MNDHEIETVSKMKWKLQLLLNCLKVKCLYFEIRDTSCKRAEDFRNSDDYYEYHCAKVCQGEIADCDLPEKWLY